MKLDTALGARYLGDGRCHFLIWAPLAHELELHILLPTEQWIAMKRLDQGYYEVLVSNVPPGTRYKYRIDRAQEFPDPASYFQPDGVHGPSQVIDHRSLSAPSQSWRGRLWQTYVIYELHVGTFTPEGTFSAIIPHLAELANLGITAIELMPVAQFPGERNWGYDGVFPFSVQNSYGGPRGLMALVDAAHQHELAVILDVVYNHVGPEGNYLGMFGPYFTTRYRIPWGAAINFDGQKSDEVKRFFIENALYWIREFQVDGLRLDAIHGIIDRSKHQFLAELSSVVRRVAKSLSRPVFLIAESDLNDCRLLKSEDHGGYGYDAQWNDDFHHALHTLITGERNGYYQDFGRLEDLAKAYTEGFVYSGQYSLYRQRRFGNSVADFPSNRLVVFSQNHDQVGNREWGERLGQLVSFDQLKLSAAFVLLSPFVPLLFMGEEYGETASFQYFTSHSDPVVAESVRRGRREEFAAFGWGKDTPDPQNVSTFLNSRLNRHLKEVGNHRLLWEFYNELLRLRRSLSVLVHVERGNMAVETDEARQILCIRRWHQGQEVFLIFHFQNTPSSATVSLPKGTWHKHLDAADLRWQGIDSKVSEMADPQGHGCELVVRDSPELITLSLPPYACMLFVRSG